MSRRKLLNEEELKIANKTSYATTDEEALRLFFEDCQLRNLRPHTFKFYRESLKAIGKPLVQMTEQDIKNHIMNMQNKGLKVTTINTKTACLSCVFQFPIQEQT